MNLLRNGLFALVLLLPSGCMMMGVQAPHGAAREATPPTGAAASTGSTAEPKDASRSAASVADKEQETQREPDGYPSGIVILGGVLMAVMMLAMLL